MPSRTGSSGTVQAHAPDGASSSPLPLFTPQSWDFFGPSEGLLSVRDAATLLGVSHHSIYEWAEKPGMDFPALRVGPFLRFELDALLAWARKGGGTGSLPPSTGTSKPPSSGRLLTAAEAGKLLKVSTASIYSWAADGRLPHSRVGATLLRFEADALLEWARAEAKKPRPTITRKRKRRAKPAPAASEGTVHHG